MSQKLSVKEIYSKVNAKGANLLIYLNYFVFCKVLYTNIDQTLPNELHGPTHCKIDDTCVFY